MMSLNLHLSEVGEGFNQGKSPTSAADEMASMNKEYSKGLQNLAVKVAFYTWILFFHYLMQEVQVRREH